VNCRRTNDRKPRATCIGESIKTVKERLDSEIVIQHNPWFDGKCSELLEYRNKCKLLWFWNPRQMQRENLKNEDLKIPYFQGKKGGVSAMKIKMSEYKTHSKVNSCMDQCGALVL
jgi:hypothetical protein